MATTPLFEPFTSSNPIRENAAVITRERLKSLMLRAWILAGLFFMALPGTLLGFSNLMAISAHHGLGALPAAWMEGHGHAQVFGWIGSFILGIGFCSQPAHGRSVVRLPLSCFILWESGVAMRWFANIYGWHWRALLPVSAGFELIAVVLFLYAASHHKLPASTEGNRAKPPMELWMVSVLIGATGFASSVIFNFVECVRLAFEGGLRSFPHSLDQKYLVVLGWGFVAPLVWGFSARWLPAFLAISKPRRVAREEYVEILNRFSGDRRVHNDDQDAMRNAAVCALLPPVQKSPVERCLEIEHQRERGFHLSLTPVPYVGDLKSADIFLLMINPTVDYEDYGTDACPSFQEALEKNRRPDFHGTEQKCFALDPHFWWSSWFAYYNANLKATARAFAAENTGMTYLSALERLSRRFAILELVPYYSVGAEQIDRILRLPLPSSEVARGAAQELAQRAEDGTATVIARWKADRWKLEGREHIFQPTQKRGRLGAVEPILNRLRVERGEFLNP